MYEVGVLRALQENMPAEEIAYDVLAGVSIGAANGGTIGMFEAGREKEAFDLLYDYWADPSEDVLFYNWPKWGPIASLWKPALVDMSPSYERTKRRLTTPMSRRVAFQAVDLNTGGVISLDETVPFELQPDMILASGTIPVFFAPTTTIEDYQLVDGGTFANLNLQAAIDRCREITDDENIIIDVLACQQQPFEVPEYEPKKLFNVWNIHEQMNNIRGVYKAQSDILPILDANPDIHLRHLIIPSEKLPGGPVPIVTDAKMLNETYEIGYKDGLNAIKEESVALESLLTHMAEYENFVTREGFD